MSGIVAILNTDGAPCDGARLRELTWTLAFRGPDGMGTEVCGAAGLGATHFKTTDESAAETQPFSFDGEVWIVADGRVDDRALLITELRGAGRRAMPADPDVKLILHAYMAWGERCVEKLLGDFALTIWDAREQTLFAARDRLGARVLYYAHVGDLLIVSNTLSCIRRHPDVTSEVNEAAIGDFLLFGRIGFPDITAFHDVRRVRAAHRLRWSIGQLRVEPYWSVPEYDEPLRLRRGEVLDQFREVMRTAVSDRLQRGGPGQDAAIELSGGVDSTCVAATACDLRRRSAVDVSLSAWTIDWRPLVPRDRERDFAQLTASALGIPHSWRSADGYTLFRTAAGQPVPALAEPTDLSLLAPGVDYVRAIATSSRVLLTGQGGDGVFRGQPLAARDALRRGRWLTLAGDAVSFVGRRRQLPPLGLRTRLRQVAGLPRHTVPEFPDWIEPGFVRRLSLGDRWHDLWKPRDGGPSPLLRPSATQCLCEPWETILEKYDAEWSGAPLDVAHPLLDVRVIEFLLRVPPIPWFWNKDLPRQAWSDSVPGPVRNRRKVPLTGNPTVAAMQRGDAVPEDWRRYPALQQYVCCERIPEMRGAAPQVAGHHQGIVTYPVSFTLWLQSLKGERTDERCSTGLERHATATARGARV